MHLKSQGALVARTLSYEQCDFAAVANVMAPEIAEVYDKSADLWRELLRRLEDGFGQREARKKIENDLKKAKDKKQKVVDPFVQFEQRVGDISDDEDDDLDAAALAAQEERRKCRGQEPKTVKSKYWGSHQRFFKSLTIASKVDATIETAKQAVEDGCECKYYAFVHCIVYFMVYIIPATFGILSWFFSFIIAYVCTN